MDKLHERQMNDSYKSLNGKCLKKFELIECRNSRKINRKSMNVPNREGVHKMYRQSRPVEKFDFVESTKKWKFNGKVCTLDVQIV